MYNTLMGKNEVKQNKVWVVAADMGYGHQRTAYPLRDIAFGGKVICANSYTGIPKKDKRFWHFAQMWCKTHILGYVFC